MSAYNELLEEYQKLNALNKAIAIMNWDRQTMMPSGGDESRTQHVKHLTSLAHNWYKDERIQRLIESSESDGDPVKKANLRLLRRDCELQNKIPSILILRKAEVSGKAYLTWREAKATSNFELLKPYLEELFDIAGETAEAIGYAEHIYDPLLDTYEEGANYEFVNAVFCKLRPEIIRTVTDVTNSGKSIEDSFLKGTWDNLTLKSLLESMISKIGFDFRRGRLDITSNAFCTNFSVNDVRMTTRPSDSIKGILFSSLHEMGHGLYEQNQNPSFDRMPICGGVSMVLHESQSRFWENTIGRSLNFWTYFYPIAQKALPQLNSISFEDFYHAINKIEPGFLRIGSDELTYNIHIMIRFEVEVAMLTGKLMVRDLPDFWNSKMQEYLGLNVECDADGCLQDVHWSRGSVGYFPTYALGNLLSWQIWDLLLCEIPNLESSISEGEFAPMLDFLKIHLYQKGKLSDPRDTIFELLGKPINSESYINHMKKKYSRIYGL